VIELAAIILSGWLRAVARASGRLTRWSLTGWRTPVFFLGVVVGILQVAERLGEQPAGTILQLQNVGYLYALGIATWWIWSARRLPIIEEFVSVDPGQPTDKDVHASGLAVLLVSKIHRYTSLFRPVDEQRPIGTATQAGAGARAEQTLPTLGAEAADDLLRSAVTTEAKVSLGPLQVPIGAVLAIAGKLVQGPRIRGTLYREEQRRVLIAQMTGRGTSHLWRVEGDPGRSLNAMVEELACRIFNDVALGSNLRWKAVSCFAEGIAAFRDSLRTPRDWLLRLQTARDRFVEAIAEDNDFGLATYNLGVVYAELDNSPSLDLPGGAPLPGPARACAIFRAAIGQMPAVAAPYFALAQMRFAESNKEDDSNRASALREEAITLCERVIELDPRNAAAFDLKGTAERIQLEPLWQRALEEQDETAREVLKREWLRSIKPSVRSRHRAVELLSLTLIKAAFLEAWSPSGERKLLYQLAHRAYRGLALMHALQAKLRLDRRQSIGLRKAVELLRESQRFDPSDPEVFALLGNVFTHLGRWRDAAAEYARAARIAPDRPGSWIDLAVAHQEAGDRRQAHAAAARAAALLDVRASPDGPEAKALVGVLRLLDPAWVGARELESSPPTEPSAWAPLSAAIRALADGDRQRAHHWARRAAAQFSPGDVPPELAQFIGALSVTEPAFVLAKKVERRRRLVGRVMDEPKMRAALSAHTRKGQLWEAAQMRMRLAEFTSEAESASLLSAAVNDLRSAGETASMQDALARAARASAKVADYDAALKAAHELARVAPMDPSSWDALGAVYAQLEAHDQARNAWSRALLFRANDPDLHWRIGHSYAAQRLDFGTVDERRGAHRAAVDHLERALQLALPESLDQQARFRLWLGILMVQAGNYASAVAYLRVVAKTKEAPITGGLRLSEAYFRSKRYDQADEILAKIEPLALEMVKAQHPLDKEIESRYGGGLTLGAVLAFIYWIKGYSRALRDQPASALLEKAAEYAAAAGDNPGCRATCAHAQGFALLRDGRDLEGAIKYLQSSLELSPDSEAYLHLGQAYVTKAETRLVFGERSAALDSAERYAGLATDVDLFGEYAVPAKALLDRVATLRAQGVKPPFVVHGSPEATRAVASETGGSGSQVY
jgi:tetratricopeptide (TPR) repeat protein